VKDNIWGVHTTPNGRWGIRKYGAKRMYKLFLTAEEATLFAYLHIVKQKNATVYLHSKDGTIEKVLRVKGEQC